MSFTRAHILKQARKSVIDFEGDEGLTEQSHKESCDINTIMRRYEKTGVLEHVKQYGGTYMDMPSGLDFQAAQNAIAQAKSMFETVPSEIRAKFDNDPARFLDFMQDPENKGRIEKMGLDASHLPDPAPTKAPEPAAPTPPADQPAD